MPRGWRTLQATGAGGRATLARPPLARTPLAALGLLEPALDELELARRHVDDRAIHELLGAALSTGAAAGAPGLLDVGRVAVDGLRLEVPDRSSAAESSRRRVSAAELALTSTSIGRSCSSCERAGRPRGRGSGGLVPDARADAASDEKTGGTGGLGGGARRWRRREVGAFLSVVGGVVSMMVVQRTVREKRRSRPRDKLHLSHAFA